MRKLFTFFILALLSIFLILTVVRAESQKLELKTQGFLVVNVIKNGKKKEVLKPLPERVYPNDVIEYRITAKNISKDILKNVKIRAQIPDSTVYLKSSASGNPEFSIDGGKTFSPEPVKYKVIENGKEVEKIATPDMYTNILWKIPEFLPGELKVLKYRVKVK